MALTDNELAYLERRALDIGNLHRMGIWTLGAHLDDDVAIWAMVTLDLDARAFGEHETDLGAPTSDDLETVGTAFRRSADPTPDADIERMADPRGKAE